nr:hypothetical protein [Streptomyces tailanensis]
MSCSSRKIAPAATATAGLTYVKTVALVGPTSWTNSRKATKARAVQITPRAVRDARAGVEGMVGGRVRAAAGA